MYDTQLMAGKIKQRAKTCGYSLQEMLCDLELGINTISQLSKGQVISSINLAKIADYLDCSVDYLLGRTDAPQINTSCNSTVNGNCNVVGNRDSTVSLNASDSKPPSLSAQESQLLDFFRSLSELNKAKALVYISELT